MFIEATKTCKHLLVTLNSWCTNLVTHRLQGICAVIDSWFLRIFPVNRVYRQNQAFLLKSLILPVVWLNPM